MKKAWITPDTPIQLLNFLPWRTITCMGCQKSYEMLYSPTLKLLDLSGIFTIAFFTVFFVDGDRAFTQEA